MTNEPEKVSVKSETTVQAPHTTCGSSGFANRAPTYRQGPLTCTSSGVANPLPLLNYILRLSQALRVVYYESRKRELKKRRKNEYRCDERLKTKAEESTCLDTRHTQCPKTL